MTALTDATGVITKNYDYDAFGNETNPDATDDNPFRYCGEYFDKETGTIYLRARYYDPATSRMLSEDSYTGDIRDPLSLNLYIYCANNPVMFVDPSGHVAITITTAAAATVAVGVLILAVDLYLNTSEGQRAINEMAKSLGHATDQIGRTFNDTAELVKSYVTAQVKSQNERMNTRDNTVYVMVDSNNKVTYVGRTNDYNRRRNEHKVKYLDNGYQMIPVMTGLTKNEARGMEQTLVSSYTLDALNNARREISTLKVDKFAEETKRALGIMGSIPQNEWLDLVGR